MKQPCANCPFRKSIAYALSPEKAHDILQAITHDKAFHCHKTVDYSESHEGRVTVESKLCFGAVLFLENTVRGGCRSNVMFRFGLISKEFELNDLRKEESVYQSFEEFLEEVVISLLKIDPTIDFSQGNFYVQTVQHNRALKVRVNLP